MNVGKVIKFIFYLAVVSLVLMSVRVAYYKYFGRDEGYGNGTANQYRLDFNDISIPKSDEKSNENCQFAYDFKNMLALIEACEKIKYIDYLRFSRPQEASNFNISQDTLQALVKAVRAEKSKLKKHIADLKSCSKDSISSKRIKALKYYLRVLDLNLQDLKEFSASKK